LDKNFDFASLPIKIRFQSYDSLVEAYNEGEAFYMNTAAQTQNMILLISIIEKDPAP